MLSVFTQYQCVTDGQTDRIAISISRVSVLTRDKPTFPQILTHYRLLVYPTYRTVFMDSFCIFFMLTGSISHSLEYGGLIHSFIHSFIFVQ